MLNLLKLFTWNLRYESLKDYINKIIFSFRCFIVSVSYRSESVLKRNEYFFIVLSYVEALRNNN